MDLESDNFTYEKLLSQYSNLASISLEEIALVLYSIHCNLLMLSPSTKDFVLK